MAKQKKADSDNFRGKVFVLVPFRAKSVTIYYGFRKLLPGWLTMANLPECWQFILHVRQGKTLNVAWCKCNVENGEIDFPFY
jgi:hypothetical protein